MLRFLPSLAVVALLASCLGGDALGGSSFVAVPRALSDTDPTLTRVGECEVLGILQLRARERWFGGWSGMTMDGDTVTMVNDAGHWGRFRLVTDEAGRPVGAEDLTVAPLGGLDGSKKDGDSEDIAAVAGGWVVSFERRHRLMRYDGLSAKPRALPLPPGAAQLPSNGGMEAVAALPGGDLLVLAEDGDLDGLSPAWIGGAGGWRSLSYQRRGFFSPTAAKALPDGSVLVLERAASLLGGLSARLVRIDAADLTEPVLRGHELMVLRPPLLTDNFEGLAVRRRGDGRLVAYLISDDNFSFLQATLLMGVLLP